MTHLDISVVCVRLTSSHSYICQQPNALVAIVADTLLCHDDELDTRRIAFVLYLVPPWQADDGGSLDMFDMDGTSRPSTLNLL